MANRYAVTLGDVTITDYIAKGSYRTEIEPVYSNSVTTMDGIDHVVLIRNKGTLVFKLNPMTDSTTATVIKTLLSQPITVSYHCLQRNEDITAQMVADGTSALYLAGVNANSEDWNDLTEISLKEL